MFVRFQVLTAASMKFRVFWDVAPCSHVEVYRHFRGAYCLHLYGTLKMEAVCTSKTSVNFNVTTWRYIPENSKLHKIVYLTMSHTTNTFLVILQVVHVNK
jgi:hypothetical protein